MNRDDIIRMAEEASGGRQPDGWGVMLDYEQLERFAALVAEAEREKVAHWMIQHDYATGPGETTEDLLAELDWQIAENWNRAMINGVETEREACAKVCGDMLAMTKYEKIPQEVRFALYEAAAAIRARGQE